MSKTTPRTGISVDGGKSPFSSARQGTNTASDYSPPHSSGLRSVANESAHGEEMATRRYGGSTKHPSMGSDNYDLNKPQKLGDANNQQGNFYDNDTRKDWRVGFGKNGVESAEGKPHFDANIRGTGPDSGAPVGGNRDTPGPGPKK